MNGFGKIVWRSHNKSLFALSVVQGKPRFDSMIIRSLLSCHLKIHVKELTIMLGYRILFFLLGDHAYVSLDQGIVVYSIRTV